MTLPEGARFTERGFVMNEEIPGAYGGSVRVYESSAASGPHLWLQAKNPPEYHDGTTVAQGAEVTLHLSLQQAEELVRQVQGLIDYQKAVWA